MTFGNEQTKPFTFGARRLFAYVLLGFAYPSMIGLSCLQYVFYDAMILAMNITNLQLGMFMTVNGIGALLLALPGGILCDRMDCHKLLLISLLISGLAGIAFALVTTYSVGLVVWSVFAVAMCGFYPSVFKVVRIIAPPEYAGRSFGLFGMCCAVGFIVTNLISLAVYDAVSLASGEVAGLSAVIWVFVAFLMVSSIVEYLLVRNIKPIDNEVVQTKMTVKDVIAVLKMPGTWLVFLTTFAIGSLRIAGGYFTPYFTSVLGTTLVFSGALAVFRQYGIRILSSPFGGWLGDKIKSNSLIIAGGFFVSSLLVGIIMGLPSSASIVVAIVLVLIFAFFDNMLVSLQYSILDEALIPAKYTGTVLGIVTIVLPDLFVPAMFGSWLDSFGAGGYTAIFWFTIALDLLGMIGALIVWRRFRKGRISEKGEGADVTDAEG